MKDNILIEFILIILTIVALYKNRMKKRTGFTPMKPGILFNNPTGLIILKKINSFGFLTTNGKDHYFIPHNTIEIHPHTKSNAKYGFIVIAGFPGCSCSKTSRILLE